ncbi:TetR/AcrR family transcriptional regulator [Enterococcus sp. LJL98]
MKKTRNPEQTRQKILDVAEELFLEKGYDDTSIQDIVDGLGGMTKGVIYHHFQSKFAIFEALLSASDNGQTFFDWQGNTGLEKLQNSIQAEFSSFKKQSIAFSASVLLKTPRIIGEQYLQSFATFAPEIQSIVQEGIDDGSIQTDYPQEIAELIILLLNLWIGFQIHEQDTQTLKRKVRFIKRTFEGLNVPLLTEEHVATADDLFDQLKK